MHDNFGTSLAADNSAFHVGRPAGIGPSPRQKKIGNRASLERTANFGSGRERERGGRGDLVAETCETLIGPQKFEGAKKAGRFLFRVGQRPVVR